MDRKMLGALLAAASLGGLVHLARRRGDAACEAADNLPKAVADPKMDSAGAELMNIGWRMRNHPDFADCADRVHEIGAWASMGRTSDMERMIAPVLGQIIGTIRKRGVPFDEQLPMAPQITAFLEALPEPLPGQLGYVDQTKLAPVDRRDVFEANVEMADVRRWTAGDGIERAIARQCTVRPIDGIEGPAMIWIQGDTSAFEDGGTATFWLRSTGNALTVVPAPEAATAVEVDPIPSSWGKDDLGWDELVHMIYALRTRIEGRINVRDPMDQLRLDLELRSFTILLFERLGKMA